MTANLSAENSHCIPTLLKVRIKKNIIFQSFTESCSLKCSWKKVSVLVDTVFSFCKHIKVKFYIQGSCHLLNELLRQFNFNKILFYRDTRSDLVLLLNDTQYHCKTQISWVSYMFLAFLMLEGNNLKYEHAFQSSLVSTL